MDLTKISVANFRSIKSQELLFPHNFMVLVGINESGKSNILRAVSLLDPAVTVTKDDIRDASHDEDDVVSESWVRFQFRLDKNEIDDVRMALEYQTLWKSDKTTILDIGSRAYDLAAFCAYKADVLYIVDLMSGKRRFSHWSLQGAQFKIHPQWKKIKPGTKVTVEVDGTSFDLSKYVLVNTEDYPSIPAELLTELDIAALNSMVGSHSTSLAEGILPKSILWEYNERNLLPAKIPLVQFSANPATCLPLKNMFLLAGYREPGKTLLEQQAKDKGIPNLLRRVSERVTAHMRAVWPEWKKQRVVLTQNGENIDAGISDEFNTYSLTRRSDGFKRFFTFMLQLSIQNATKDIRDNVIVIDEPDIGLHPTGIQYLREELKQISASNKVIVSSHSIFMVDREIVDRHYIVKKSQEKTTVTIVDSSNVTDEEVVYKALGYSLFELLRPVNLIFEGWRDKEFFRRFMASRRGKGLLTKEQGKQLGLLHAMAASDIPRVANVCENFNRKYFIISDSDSPSREKQKRFHDPKRWTCYEDIKGVSAITTEDFLSNPSINRALKRILSEHVPSLAVKTPDSLDEGKIEYIKKQLSQQGVAGEDLRKLMEGLKGEIFESAKIDEINKQYDLVCKRLIEQLFA